MKNMRKSPLLAMAMLFFASAAPMISNAAGTTASSLLSSVQQKTKDLGNNVRNGTKYAYDATKNSFSKLQSYANKKVEPMETKLNAFTHTLGEKAASFGKSTVNLGQKLVDKAGKYVVKPTLKAGKYLGNKTVEAAQYVEKTGKDTWKKMRTK